MHVASRPMTAPVALIERPQTVDGECHMLRVLVFQEGLLPAWLLLSLGRLLGHL